MIKLYNNPKTRNNQPPFMAYSDAHQDLIGYGTTAQEAISAYKRAVWQHIEMLRTLDYNQVGVVTSAGKPA